MQIKSGIVSFLCTAASIVSLNANAQQIPALAQPTVRITQLVSDQSLVVLKGNVSPRARAQFDQGIAGSGLATGRLRLMLRPSSAQQQALTEYLGALQDPHSASYHKWLTPAGFGANFGISDQDLETVTAWLRSEGFTVDAPPASRNFITFSGTFGQVDQAFHTSMHSYLIGGVLHYANATDPSVPAALAPVVLAISPLNDFRPKPTLVQQMHGQAVKAGLHAHMTETQGKSLSPALTVNDSGNFLLVTPADAATIYDSPNSYNTRYAANGQSQQQGYGVKIGLVGDSDLPTQDYLNYRALFLGEASPTAPQLVVDGTDPGQVNDGSSEEALVDTELSAAMAPAAQIYFYSSADDLLQYGPLDAAVRAIEDNNVSILSMSFSSCETDLGPGGNSQVAAIWQQAAAQGITVLVSAGDTGSASCDDDAGNLNQAQDGLSVNGLGSTPYNISVGGTDFEVLGTNFTQYVNPYTASSSTTYDSALGYIPETPWNESISNYPPGSYTTNTAKEYTSSTDSTPFTALIAGGGGASNAAICLSGTDSNGNCLGLLSGYSSPSFQTGISVSGQNPNTVAAGVRYLPDVSLFASSGSEYPATWLLCADSAVTGASQTYTDCVANSSNEFQFDGVGGTSTSSPAFAGILAIISGSRGGERLGLANDTLYNLYATSSSASSIFHDVTLGNNSVPCASGSPNCGSNGFLTGFNAGTGYDLATGLGSVDITKLMNAWNSVQFTPTSLALSAGTSSGTLGTSPISITHGTAITLSAALSPTSAVGDVSVTGTTGQAGLAVNEVIPLTNGAGSISVEDLPGGNYYINGYYPGDVSHSPSKSSTPIELTVSPEASLPVLYVESYNLAANKYYENPTSITYGSYAYAYVQPQNANGNVSHGIATGTVTLLNGSTPFAVSNFQATETLNSQGTASYPLYELPPAAYTFNASYSGDDSYNASTTTSAQAVAVTIQQDPTTMVIHVGNATTANPGALQVELDTTSFGVYPTGAITLTVNGTAYTSTGVTQETQSNGAVSELATFAVPATALGGSGGFSLAATYAGDGNYSSSAAASCTYVPSADSAALLPPTAPRGSPRSFIAAAGCGLCSLMFLLVPARRRALRSLLVLCFAAGLLGVTGCGGNSGFSTGGGGGGITVHTTCSK